MANYNLSQTGAQVQALLDAVASGYVLLGTATPTTTPDTTNPNVCYLATTPGTYTSFGSSVLSTNNIGVLCWNGSTWTLYTSPCLTNSDAIPVANSVNPVQSGAVYPIYEELYGASENQVIGKLGTIESYMAVSRGGGGSGSTTYVTNIYPIEQGKKYVISVPLAGNNAMYTLGYTDYATLMDKSYYSDAHVFEFTDTIGTSAAFTYTINSAGNYPCLMISYKASGGEPTITTPVNVSPVVVKTTSQTFTDSAKSQARTNIGAASDSLNTIVYNSNTQLYDYATIGTVNGVVGSNGDLQTASDGFATGLIPIQPNKYYYLSNRVSNSVAGIRCLKADKTTKQKVINAVTGTEGTYYYLYNDDNTTSVKNGMFKTPAEAAYLQISLTALNVTTLGTAYQIMLELVGDTYNPNFIPSTYQSFGESLKVRNDKLQYPVNGGQTLKVLLIGSSHGMNTIGQFPFLAYHAGIDVIVGNFYQGSLSLSQVAAYCNDSTSLSGSWYKKAENGVWTTENKTTLKDLLQNELWDVISIQRSASEDETWTSQQAQDFETILAYITAKCYWSPKVVFNSGFADRTNHESTTTTIWSTAQNVKTDYGIDIIPCAPIIEACRQNTTLNALGSYSTSPASLTCDGQHLDQGIGMYVTGCICFEFFLKHLNKSVLCSQYLPTATDMTPFWYDASKFTAITEANAKLIRQIVSAWFANN